MPKPKRRNPDPLNLRRVKQRIGEIKLGMQYIVGTANKNNRRRTTLPRRPKRR